MTIWDPVSKQPLFKAAVCSVTFVRSGDGPAPAPTTAASGAPGLPLTSGGEPSSEDADVPTPAYPLDRAVAP